MKIPPLKNCDTKIAFITPELTPSITNTLNPSNFNGKGNSLPTSYKSSTSSLSVAGEEQFQVQHCSIYIWCQIIYDCHINFLLYVLLKKEKENPIVCIKSRSLCPKNLTVELHILYALNRHVKFCISQILFTIWSISLYFLHNFKQQKLVI